MTRMRDEMEKLDCGIRRFTGDDLSALTLADINALEQQLEFSVTKIRARKHQLLNQQLDNLRRKEHILEDQNSFLCRMINENHQATTVGGNVKMVDMAPVLSMLTAPAPAYYDEESSSTALQLTPPLHADAAAAAGYRHKLSFFSPTAAAGEAAGGRRRGQVEEAPQPEGQRERDKKESRRSRRDDRGTMRRRKKQQHGDRGKDKERDSKEKHSKEEKSKRRHKDDGLKEISKEDYFSKNSEFATWLKVESRYFSDLSSESACDLFEKFVKHWNKGKLPSQYHEGTSSGPRSTHRWNIKA
ncbi:hypothetical protein ABZP36_022066 [Zizania latifolia]